MNNNVIQLILAGAAITAVCTDYLKNIHTHTVRHLDIIKGVFYSPTEAQVNCLKNNFKIYLNLI